MLVLENGKPTPVRVGLGLTDGTYTEITSGLKGGEEIVTSIVNGQSTTSWTGSSTTGGAGGWGATPDEPTGWRIPRRLEAASNRPDSSQRRGGASR